MIVAIGDLHMGFHTAAFTPTNLLEMQMFQLYDLLDDAVKHNAEHVVFLGDVFDAVNPPQSVVATFMRVIFDKKYSHMTIHIYHGNHDCDGGQNALFAVRQASQMTKNVKVYLEPYVDEYWHDDLAMDFLPFPNASCATRNSIVFIHNEFVGTKRDNGSVYDIGRTFDPKLAEIKGQFYVSGHLHGQQAYDRLIFPGSPAAYKMYYPSKKYVLHIDTDRELTKESFKLVEWEPHWHLWRFDVNDAKSEEVLMKSLDAVATPIKVKVVAFDNWRVNKQIADDPRVVIDNSKLATPMMFERVKSSPFQSDYEWIRANLPDFIQRNRVKMNAAMGFVKDVSRS